MSEIKILDGFQPNEAGSESPVIDAMTRRVTEGRRRGSEGLFPNGAIDCCGEYMFIRAVTLTVDGATISMPACVVHFIAHHRDEAMRFDPGLEQKVALLPEPGTPTANELAGEHF